MTAFRAVLATCVALAGFALAAQPALGNHEGTPSGVSLVPEKDAVTIPESIRLTANADRHLYGTGYTVVVVDDDKGTEIGSPCYQTPCANYGTTGWDDNANPQPRHFHAELRGPGGGTVATSGQVTVDVRKHTWDIVSVVPDPEARVVPGEIRFTATLDHTTYGTPYQIYIYDEDNPTSPTTCGQYICGKSIWRSWADNLSPKPAQVRVQVRNAEGDVASNTVYEVGYFRRFIFTPILSFSTETGANGGVVHKATARLAATDPSLYATPYSIKIEKADGTEVCSAPQIGCERAVTVGETYRAVVEDSLGRNFGQSAAWTLTDSGPQPAAVGDLDLAALAAASGGVDICTRLGLSPYKTNVVGPVTSPGDQWEACAAAAAAGATTLAILMAVADTPGGEANLWWLQGDVIKETPAPETPPSPEDTKAPRPLPLPLLPDVQKLADRLMSQNKEIDQQVADDVATQCAFLHWRAGKGSGRCSSLPIFASGSDVAEATDHDLGALAEVGYAPWLLLNREQSSTKPGDGWQTTGGRCTSTELRACHEYPFFGTEQGGPLAYKSGPEPIIGLVLREHNSLQGTRYSQFISPGQCNMKTGTPDPTGEKNSTGGDPFLAIPLPPEWERPTLWLCNGKTE